jgi:transmembrane sensor
MAAPIDPQILGEAADWLVQLHSGEVTGADHQAIAQWRGRSEQHAQAWQRAEALLGDFRSVPAGIAVQTLRNVDRRKGVQRRQLLNRLGLLLLGGPAAWLAWQQKPWEVWASDLHTATGEQKQLRLPDGSQLLLNTATAIDIAFNDQQRRVRLLRGEILLTVAAEPGPVAPSPAEPARTVAGVRVESRPFIVQTDQGSARAMGTRFSVRVLDDRSQVAASEGAVMLLPLHDPIGAVIKAGQTASFDRDQVSAPRALAAGALSWENGMLLAQDMRLGEVLEELARYRPGVLRCHGAVADMRVSGAFSLRDSDASLRLLQDTLPISVSRMTPYWVSVEART